MPPTTRPDPHQLADELLDDVRRARRQARPRVPLLLRSAELLALAPPLQAEVLQHARRGLNNAPATVLVLLALTAASVALLYLVAPPPWMVLGWLPAKAWHTASLRARARRLARELLASP